MALALLLWPGLLYATDRLAELAKHGNAALATKDFPAAEQDYRAILDINPELAEMRSNLGLALYMQRKYDQAEHEFDQAVRANPRLFVPNYFLGVRLFKTNRYGQARTYLAAALKINPGDLQTQEWLAATYIGLQDLDQGIRQYRQILKQDPRSADALYSIGKVFIDLIDRSLKVILDRPDNVYYGRLLVEAVRGDDEWRRLVDSRLPPILAANPLAPELRYELGVLRLTGGRTEEAAQLFREEIAIDPFSFQAYYGLAQLSLASDQLGSFAAELKRAVAIRPEFFCPPPVLQVKPSMARLEAILQNPAEPLAAQFAAVQLGRQNSFCDQVAPFLRRSEAKDKAAGKTAEAFFREKRYEAAISLWRTRSKLTPSDQWNLAEAYFKIGKVEECAAVLKTLLGTPEYRYAANYLLSKSYQELALQTLAQIGRIDPDSYRVHQLMGEAHSVRQNMPQAVAEFQAALARKPEDAELHHQLGRAYYAMAEFPEALRALEKSLEIDQSNAEVSFLAGKIQLTLEEPAKALSLFEQALQLNPGMLKAHAELGRAYLRLNQWRQAATELELAADADVGGELYYELFRAYSRLDQNEKAQQALAMSTKRREQKLKRERAKLSSPSSL
jgi:tetratricopeptide (TPR) repeat protein